VLAGYDEEKQEATFSAYVNPLVRWLWIGGWVMAVGTLFAMLPLSPTKQDTMPPLSQKRTRPSQRAAKRKEASAALA
jgi:hypothetical protein